MEQAAEQQELRGVSALADRFAGIIAEPVIAFLEDMGRIVGFLVQILKASWSREQYWDVVRYQLYQTGWRSVPIAILAGVFVGGIFAIQIYDNLYEFGATAMLGGISASITVREVGPLMIALLLGARIGAFTAAELGTMNVTDQIDAMRCLATDPIKYLVVPRFYALIIMSWVLTIIGIVIGVLGAAVVANLICNVNFHLFFSNIADLVDLYSFFSGLIKSMFFGVLVSTVGCYYGFHVRGGAEDVGRNVNKAVVVLGIGLLAMDYVLALLNDAIYVAFFKA